MDVSKRDLSGGRMNAFLGHVVGALALLAAILLGIVAWEWLQRTGAFLPVPFEDVEVTEKSLDDGVLYVRFNYIKRACTIRKLRMVGITLGVVEDLEWRWEDGRELTIDMEPGAQSGAFLIETNGNDIVEIRTRHDCDGVSVHRTFLRLELKNGDPQLGQTRSLKLK
jgi:hypothetical protein